MSRERQINHHDQDRAAALQDKVRDEAGGNNSLIKTPEEARKANLLDKVARQEGY